MEVYKNGILLASRNVSAWPFSTGGGYIGVWFANAMNQLLDNFGGGTIAGGEGFSLNNAFAPLVPLTAVDPFNMTSTDASPFWQGLTLGASQSSQVTFTNIQGAIGKPRSNGVWDAGAGEVLYDAPHGRIQLWTYSASAQTGWTQRGTDIPVTFADGDVFSARAKSDGTIEIYRNGILLVTRTLGSKAPALAQNNGLFQPVSYNFPAPIFAPLQQSTSQTINYIYDPLQRLKQANYSNGDYYHYTYDAVGNRLTQNKSIIGLVITDTYVYDNANRLATVNGVTYTFDANGNLLNDGVTAYTYDSANRLKTLTNATTAATYQYNGLNDRLRETVNGSTTTFTMDLNTGLTQVLSDGPNNYIYGNGRIAQATGTTTEYFLGDALGSVRQLTNASGAITYAKAYDPYGVVTSTTGSSQSAYGYTGEFSGDSTQLVYLRARQYSPGTGRFLTRDTWGGEGNSPMSFNRWNYVDGNPINRIDPTGMCWIISGGKNVWMPDGATPCQNGNTTSTPPSQYIPLPYLPDYLMGNCNITLNLAPATGDLSEDDIKILTLFIVAESTHGMVPDNVNLMKAWALLNKHSYDLLKHYPNCWSPFKSWKHHERDIIEKRLGIKAPDEIMNSKNESFIMDYEKAELLKEYTKAVSGVWTTIEPWRVSQIGVVVRSAVRSWALNGSRSAADPVHGATDFTDAGGLCFPGPTCNKPFQDMPTYGTAILVHDKIDYWRRTMYFDDSRGFTTELYQIGIDPDHDNRQQWSFTRFKYPDGGWPASP